MLPAGRWCRRCLMTPLNPPPRAIFFEGVLSLMAYVPHYLQHLSGSLTRLWWPVRRMKDQIAEYAVRWDGGPLWLHYRSTHGGG